jgi:cell division septum initiation protein DivIVA
MDEPDPIPNRPIKKLRRAWLAGYRVGDVEVLLAELRFKVTHLRDETERLTVRLSEVERLRTETVEAAAQPVEAAAQPVVDQVGEVAPVAASTIAREPEPTHAPLPETILSAQYSPAMASESALRRTRFGGFRRGDVEAALAHDRLVVSRLELELHAATQRVNALQLEVGELQARIAAGRERELSLARSLDEIQQRRDQLDREARHRAEQLVRDAEDVVASLKTEGLRQVGELQGQVETLFELRTTLTHAMQGLSADLAAAMARLASAPATAIDREPEDQLSRWAQPDP